MKSEIRIGIVEDELLIAEKIKHILTEFGYAVCEPVSSYDETMEMIKTQKPDLLLLDINLSGEKDGINTAQKINELYQLPFIFLTAYSDANTIERAKEVKPFAYLVKPFTKEELFASIEIAFNNYMSLKPLAGKTEGGKEKRDFIFIREHHRFIKISFREIVYVESRENYVVIHTKDKRNTIVRSGFSDFLEQLPAGIFYKTHRSFAVQTDFIENVEPTEILAGGFKVPVSNSYRAGLFALLGIKE